MVRRSLALLTVFGTLVYAHGIDKPPIFTEPLSKETRNVKPKENVTVVCLAEAKPAATYRWNLNNIQIPKYSNYLPYNGTLQIIGFRNENEGNYQCFAENIVNGRRAVAMSSFITIREAVLGSQWSSLEHGTTTKQEREYLQFRCENPPKCVPTGQLSWNQVSVTSSSMENKEVQNSDRIYIDNEGTLHFIYLTTGDSSGSLRYKCGLRNSVLDLIKLGSDRKLLVNTNPDGLPFVGAKNKFFTNPAKFLRTGSAEIECVFSGYPIPTITWRDKEKNIITGNTEKYTLSNFNHKLTIKNLQEEDEGKYYCEGRNEKNTEEIEIFLNVTSGPIWEKSLSSQTKPEGTDAIFNCKARPALNERLLDAPTWFINGEKINLNKNEGKMEFSDNFQVLTVKNLNEKTDIKCFQCNVSNEIGYEMGHGCLNVIEKHEVDTAGNPVGTFWWIPFIMLALVIIIIIIAYAVLRAGEKGTFPSSPPKIDVPEKKDIQILYKDQDYELSCEARGDPTPTYKWKLNNEDIPADSNIEVNSTTGQLTISKMTYIEQGDYQCIATNTISGKEAVAMSPVVTLLIAEFDAQWEDPDEGDEIYKEGVYVKLPCENQPKSVPKPQYSWYLAEGEETRGEVKSNDRKYVDGEGTLHFMYILKEDDNLQLRYKCGLFNSKLDTFRLGSKKNVPVEADPRGIQQIGAKFEFITPNPTAVIAKNAELECVFSGYPIPEIKWFENETPIEKSEKYEFPEGTFGRKLVIHNVDERDETTYYCRGSNEKSSTEKIPMFLDVTSGPIWVKSLSSLMEVEGRDAVFTCKARPAVGDKALNEPQWFQNGELLPAENTGKFEFSDSKQVLTVRKINKDTDITCFQCNVSNDRGYEFADGCLNIIEAIVVTSQPALEQVVKKGDLVNLTVTTTTDPDMALQYKWKFNNITYINNDLPPFVVFNSTSFEAYINTSSLTDKEFLRIKGTYYREFYHRYETKTVSIVIKLRIPEKREVDTAGNPVGTFWWIPFNLLALVIIIIIIAYAVLRAREKGTFSLSCR